MGQVAASGEVATWEKVATAATGGAAAIGEAASRQAMGATRVMRETECIPIFDNFRRMPTANAEGLDRIGGRHQKVPRETFQIDTGPWRSPSARSDVLKNALGQQRPSMRQQRESRRGRGRRQQERQRRQQGQAAKRRHKRRQSPERSD